MPSLCEYVQRMAKLKKKKRKKPNVYSIQFSKDTKIISTKAYPSKKKNICVRYIHRTCSYINIKLPAIIHIPHSAKNVLRRVYARAELNTCCDTKFTRHMAKSTRRSAAQATESFKSVRVFANESKIPADIFGKNSNHKKNEMCPRYSKPNQITSNTRLAKF